MQAEPAARLICAGMDREPEPPVSAVDQLAGLHQRASAFQLHRAAGDEQVQVRCGGQGDGLAGRGMAVRHGDGNSAEEQLRGGGGDGERLVQGDGVEIGRIPVSEILI